METFTNDYYKEQDIKKSLNRLNNKNKPDPDLFYLEVYFKINEATDNGRIYTFHNFTEVLDKQLTGPFRQPIPLYQNNLIAIKNKRGPNLMDTLGTVLHYYIQDNKIYVSFNKVQTFVIRKIAFLSNGEVNSDNIVTMDTIKSFYLEHDKY